MSVTLRRLGIVMLLVAVGVLPACSGQEPPATEPDVPETEPAPETRPEPQPAEPPEAGDWDAAETSGDVLTPDRINEMDVLRPVYFDYDRSEIRPDQRPVLQQNATWLRQNPTVRILVEGHCDERGTREYNQALGNRRAAATRDYLVSLGVSQDRIEIISYGEERPIAQGNDEAAWARNRRAQFTAISVGD